MSLREARVRAWIPHQGPGGRNRHRRRVNSRLLLGVVASMFFVDMLIYGIVVPVLPTLAAPAGLKSFEVGTVFACYGLAYFIATPIAGRLVDRRGTRGVFLTGAVVLTLATFLFGLAGDLAALVMCRMLQGAGAAAIWVAGYATLVETFAREQRGRAVATASIGTALGLLIGPVVGGLLLEMHGPRAPFVLGALLAGAAGGLLILVLPSTAHRLPPTDCRIRFGLRGLPLAAVPWLVASLAAGLALGGVEATLPIDLSSRLRLPGTTIGLLFALTTAGFVASSQGAGRVSDCRRRARTLAAGWGGVCVGLVLLGQSAQLMGQALALLLLGAGLGAMVATILPALADAFEARGFQQPGMSAAAYNLSFSAGAMAGAPLAGALVQELSFRAATLIVALGTLACGVFAAIARVSLVPRAV